LLQVKNRAMIAAGLAATATDVERLGETLGGEAAKPWS
jgi:hypothetical protein